MEGPLGWERSRIWQPERYFGRSLLPGSIPGWPERRMHSRSDRYRTLLRKLYSDRGTPFEQHRDRDTTNGVQALGDVMPVSGCLGPWATESSTNYTTCTRAQQHLHLELPKITTPPLESPNEETIKSIHDSTTSPTVPPNHSWAIWFHKSKSEINILPESHRSFANDLKG